LMLIIFSQVKCISLCGVASSGISIWSSKHEGNPEMAM